MISCLTGASTGTSKRTAAYQQACASPFLTPVTDEIAPGYSESVQEPMDLGTVRQKLTDGEYGTDDGVVARFAADVRLVYRNAVT